MLRRMPLGVPASQGGIDEATLQDLLFRHPQTLPIASIDPANVGAVAVCRELSTQAGYVDALYVNSQGCLTLAEFRLWRNPQAWRKVIGQILDYAKEIAAWNYGRTTQHAGYRTSQRIRERLEESFGRENVQRGQRQTRFRGRCRVEASCALALAACNLVRLSRLPATASP